MRQLGSQPPHSQQQLLVRWGGCWGWGLAAGGAHSPCTDSAIPVTLRPTLPTMGGGAHGGYHTCPALIPDALIPLVLTVAFGVYCVMGLTFFVMGIAYMGDAGTVASVGMYLVFIGLIMLIMGGLALFANQKQIWLILFVIELFNIALFLVLYCLIVVVLMMATDTTDPVRDATKETWEMTKPALTIPGSDPDGDEVFTYCQTMSEGTACKNFYRDAIKTATCQFNAGYSPMEILNNCSILWDPVDAMGSGVNTGCATLLGKGTANVPQVNDNNPNFGGDKLNEMEGTCRKCESACMERQIQDVKDNLVPASLFVLGLIFYLAITIVWNQIMLAGDIEGIPQTVGLVLNGLLMALSFALMISAGVGAWKASDACPKTADGCVPKSMIMLVLLGVSCFGLSAVAVFGTWKQIPIAVTVVTIVMVFVMLFMVLFGIILSMSTGVMMEDIEYYYDTQYPKLRSAMEKADNSYCQMTKAQCTELIQNRADTNFDGIPVQTDDYKEAVLSDGNQVYVTFDAVKKHMFAEASAAAGETDSSGNSAAPTWLSPCKTTAICIYCDDLLDRVPYEQISMYNLLATAPAEAGETCDLTTDTTGTCIEKAPNFAWAMGLTGGNNATGGAAFGGWKTEGTWYDSDPGDGTKEIEALDKWFAPSYMTIGAKRPQLVDDASQTRQVGYASGVPDGLSANSLMCMGIDAIDRDFSDHHSHIGHDLVDDFDECYGVFSANEDHALHNVRCAGTTTVNLGQMKRAFTISATDPCGTDAELNVESADSWTSKVANFTKYDPVSKTALPYCEEAITEYVQDERYCKDPDDRTDNEKWTYYANCDSCTSAFYDFTFNLPGPEVSKRQCLNFVIGHYQDSCGSTDINACFEAIYSLTNTCPTTGCTGDNSDRNRNHNYLIDMAFDDGSSFCGYDDESCKAKIKWDIEGSMTEIGIAGAIFLVFFVATIYCTLVAIEHYKAGNDDDDGDDNDDE
jgi:hypothetical protein